MASGLFGSGPQSGILNTVQSSYTGMLNAEIQKGKGVSTALGAFGEAISPKSIGMRQFKKDFADADWNDPATYMKAGQQIMQFDTNGGLSMIQRGQAMAASQAAQAAPNMQLIERVDPETGVTSQVAVDMNKLEEGAEFTTGVPETAKDEWILASRYENGVEIKGRMHKFSGVFESFEGTGKPVDTGKGNNDDSKAVGLGTLNPSDYTSKSYNDYLETRTNDDPNGDVSLLVRKEQTISKSSEDKLISSQEAAQETSTALRQTRALLNNEEQLNNLTSGVFGTLTEAGKAFFGTGDQQSVYKQSFDRIINSSIMQNLPPGPASDKDIEIVSKGYPNSSSSPEVIKEFLGALANLQEAEIVYSDFVSAYISSNNNTKNMRQTWSQFTKVPTQGVETLRKSIAEGTYTKESLIKQFKQKYGFDPTPFYGFMPAPVK